MDRHSRLQDGSEPFAEAPRRLLVREVHVERR
jgi:hypothetical protein